MPKRPRNTVDPTQKWAQGKGQGTGSSYEPWLNIQGVTSIGASSRIKGWKTQRIHHLLSSLETQFFYVLEWSANVIDIREQYPLWPLEDTIKIAEHIGVRHPIIPRTKQHNVLTTDFVVTISTGNETRDIARTIKCAKDLEDTRTLEKLEIERLWWQARGTDWGIVTEHEIPHPLVENVKDLHSFYSLEGFPDLQKNTNELAEYVTAAVRNDSRPLSKISLECDRALSLPKNSTLALAKHLIATRQWIVDLNTKFLPTQPLELLEVRLEGT